ncbi:MAG: hypothetical protein AAGC76_09400 [Luteibacter sp.]|uniref:hypothetical protein n=1 Tax=Luteibacter sp. TaxID=1886636 RepID=UPI0028081814|nr:hypothetical protein [Luteibacter sp.]MDQ7996057.1 hypothetical protein [Luteibacter sp.]
MVVSTAYKVHSDQQVAKRQDSQLAQQIRTDSAHQQDADAAVADLINKTSQSNDTGQQQSLLGQFTQQIQNARGNATGGLNQVGNVSDAYKASGADAALGITDYGKKVADLTSRIDAPNLQRQDEQADRLRFSSELGGISRDAAGDDFLAKLRLQRIRSNPWGDAAADALGAYGGAKLSGGGYSTPNSSGSVTFGGGYGTNLPFG